MSSTDDAAARLDTSSFHRAVGQLSDSYAIANSELRKPDSAFRLYLRAGAIQAFEYTFELSEKMLRRYLRATERAEASVTELTFAELVRLGYKRGLVKNELREWHAYRTARNRTSHTYNEVDAQAVFEGIPAFLEDARHLVERLDTAIAERARRDA